MFNLAGLFSFLTIAIVNLTRLIRSGINVLLNNFTYSTSLAVTEPVKLAL